MEAARFLAVAVIGLAVDIAVAWSASHFLDLPLWLAAAIGFVVAATLNYMLHQLWTFRLGAERPTAGRVMRYSIALFATFLARIATVATLAAIFGNAYALPVLFAGAGISFTVNYLLSKHFVFRPRAKSKEYVP